MNGDFHYLAEFSGREIAQIRRYEFLSARHAAGQRCAKAELPGLLAQIERPLAAEIV